MAGGDDARSRLHTGVWWDLNTCPVPAGVDPLSVRRCIETALHKRIGRSSAVSIYAMGNLEYISSDFLEMISYSGIVLIHAPCGVLEFCCFLREWSKSTFGASGYTMLISDDYRLAIPSIFQRFPSLTNFCAYPKDGQLLPLAEQRNATVLPNEFVWETLLFDHYGNIENIDINARHGNPLYICNMCDTYYEIFDEFATHLNSKEHIDELFDMVPKDSGEPKHFCQVCNYPAYDNYNLLLHNKTKKPRRKVRTSCLLACNRGRPWAKAREAKASGAKIY